MWKLSIRLLVILFAIAGRSVVVGQDGKTPVLAYSKTITEAQADLDAGKVEDARKKLQSTEKSLRSFEYEYLLARSVGKEPTPGLIQTIARPKVESRYGMINPISHQFVYICRDGSLHVHDLSKPGDPAQVHPQAERGAIWSGAFSLDGKAFAAGHANGDVVVWDTKTWKVKHAFAVGDKAPVRELVISPDGSAVIAEGKTEVELWSVSGDAPKKIAGVGERYNFGEGMAFSPKGDLIATGGMFDIVLFDAKTGEKKRSMRHASYTMGLEFSPDGKQIASAPRGNVNRFIAVFDVNGEKPVFNTGPFAGYIAGMVFTPDGKRIIATGTEKKVRVVDVATGAIVMTLDRPDHVAKPSITTDGRIVGWAEPGGYRFIDLGKKPEEAK